MRSAHFKIGMGLGKAGRRNEGGDPASRSSSFHLRAVCRCRLKQLSSLAKLTQCTNPTMLACRGKQTCFPEALQTSESSKKSPAWSGEDGRWRVMDSLLLQASSTRARVWLRSQPKRYAEIQRAYCNASSLCLEEASIESLLRARCSAGASRSFQNSTANHPENLEIPLW